MLVRPPSKERMKMTPRITAATLDELSDENDFMNTINALEEEKKCHVS